jgi:glycosyltransferase involved in cell wall biosynthesis
MKSNPLVSAVVPVYNVEKYMDECLRSIVSQTYKHVEIILVDDGSTDASGKKCDEWARRDKRIKVIHKKNEGLNFARRTGVEESHGKYITFIDSDDAVDAGFVKSLLSILERSRVGIAICGYQIFNKKIPQTWKSPGKVITELNKRKIFEYSKTWLLGKDIIMMTAWGKMFKSEIIKATDWTFANYRVNEDEFETTQWYNLNTKGIAVTDEPLYYYRKSNNSLTNSKYHNTNPTGKEINKFELLNELFDKTRAYWADPSFDDLLLNKFEGETFWFLGLLGSKDTELSDNINSAVDNLHKIINTYKGRAMRLEQELAQTKFNYENSRPWRLTKPFRAIAGVFGVRNNKK